MGNAGGVLIVLEGVEGVGKTTQWERLSDRLRGVGHTVVAVREPGGTLPGNTIRQLLLDPAVTLSARAEALLFAASRAEIITQVIQPALARGDIIVLDRFLLSTYAYQGAGRGLDMGALRSINEFATSGVTPDLTLLLTMPLDAALARAGSRSAADRIEREDRSFHATVAAAFADATTSAWQDAHPECGPVVPIDADAAPDAVTERCAGELARRWPLRFGRLLEDSMVSSSQTNI